MRTWLLLAGAVLSEVIGSLSLKAAIDRPAWYAFTVLGYLASFAFLAAVLRAGMVLGVAYGIWGATGVALTAGMSAVIYDEPLTPVMLVGIILIIIGVLAVEIGSQKTEERQQGAV